MLSGCAGSPLWQHNRPSRLLALSLFSCCDAVNRTRGERRACDEVEAVHHNFAPPPPRSTAEHIFGIVGRFHLELSLRQPMS